MKQESQNVRRRWRIPSFGVGALLALTACVASYLAGRQQGFSCAREMWTGLPSTARVYNVHDLISKKISQTDRFTAESLSDFLQKEIKLSGVSKASPDYKVLDGPMAGTFMIATNEVAHKKTAMILERLRASNRE